MPPQMSGFPLIAALGLLLPGLAQSYVGPGAGLSAIGTVLALIGAVVLGIFGFLWYPIKRLLAKRRGKSPPADPLQR
jgi:hypothetical protein